MANEKQQLIDELKALLEQDGTAQKEQVEQLKNQFYRQYHQELEALRQEALQAAEGDEAAMETWQPPVDEQEQEFRELLAQYKKQRAEAAARQEAEMQANLERKQDILKEMKQLAEAECADVMDNLKRMRELQAEWKTIGQVPAPKVQEMWKQYQQYQEQFYDLVKINIELRDLDFKKNLEMKTLLCEAAEKLQENESVIEASRALQQLHDEWAEIGPVARELREDLWNRFKAASSIINKKHQAYFDELHQKEQENLEKKQAIIDQLKALEYADIKQNKLWDELTEKVQALQNEWRTIGFAPKKQNQAIYEEYRALCDAFFQAKTAYYKGLRDELTQNLKRKRALIEQAEALKDSQDWRETGDKLMELQREWKQIGPVARKYSDELWKKFNETCDVFFNARREAQKESREESRKNRVERAVKAAAGQGAEGLKRMHDRLQQEIKTAENNILFFTAKSKTANKLVDDMQKKIDALKKQLADIEQKMEAED
jgi:hypothetical protein